jgi:hypothetical protein
MGLFDLFGVGPVAELAGKIIEMFPNAEQRAKATTALQDLVSKVAEQQSAINVEEAKSDSLFVSGWRPACGWLCVCALCYTSIIAPATGFPPGSTEVLVTLLFGMLGLGSMRSFDKYTNADRDVPASRRK